MKEWKRERETGRSGKRKEDKLWSKIWRKERLGRKGGNDDGNKTFQALPFPFSESKGLENKYGEERARKEEEERCYSE